MCKNDLLALLYWNQCRQSLDCDIEDMCQRIRRKHLRKFRGLMQSQKPTRQLHPHLIPNFVINLSSKRISPTEFDVLNRGLKYASKPTTAPLPEILVDIESAIQFKSHSERERIRGGVKNNLLRLNKKDHPPKHFPKREIGFKISKGKGCHLR